MMISITNTEIPPMANRRARDIHFLKVHGVLNIVPKFPQLFKNRTVTVDKPQICFGAISTRYWL